MPDSTQSVLLVSYFTLVCAYIVDTSAASALGSHVENGVKQQYSPNKDSVSSFPKYRHTWNTNGETEIPDDYGQQSIPKCNCNITYADCRNRNLTEVPQNLPQTLLVLQLGGNHIHALPDSVFRRYPDLEKLDLQGNNMSRLSNGSFEGLRKLTLLNLRNNKLEMTPGRFPLDVFRPLTSLTDLLIHRNTPNLTKSDLAYPHEALAPLVNLRKLHMDGLPSYRKSPFGTGFSNLTNLHTLILSGYKEGYCKMWGLVKDTFQNLETIENLQLSDCFIKGNRIDPGAFRPLKRLRKLNLIHNEDIDIEYLDNVFYGLRDAVNLTDLEMELTVNRYSLGICLQSSYIQNFPQHLTYFDARENNLEAVDRHVISKLSPSLETLLLNGNKFVFGTYLEDLPKMKNLKYISLSGGSFSYNIPSIYPYHEDNETTKGILVNSTCNLYSPGELGERRKKFILKLPPKLKVIEMNNAGLTYILSKLVVDPQNELQNLSLQSNHFYELKGPFIGLNSLKFLDVSSSYVSKISHEFFNNLTSLEILRIDTNLIRDHFSTDKHNRVFSPLTNLRILNMSFNDIRVLSPQVFVALKNLTHLLLDRNPLSELNVVIEHMDNLQVLNISYTRIPTLRKEIRDHIDKLLGDGKNVSVYMARAPIACDCENVEFIKWIANSSAFKDIFVSHYVCQKESIEESITDGYKQIMFILTKQCSSHTVEFFIVGSCTFVAVCVIFCAVLYRFRWNIRYMYYVAYMQYTKKSRATDNSFEYDAFICYDESDRKFSEKVLDKELTNRDLKILLHRRDFTAGEYITSNIVQAVCRSRKTVVILTHNLLESQWCSYEIEMANMESLSTGRKVLIFVLMENIPVQKLGKDLLYNIKNNTYLEYPNDPDHNEPLQAWWNKLANDIRN